MKHFKSLFCIILVAVLLSGCSFSLASSVNDLISSVSPFGDNADVKKAMDDFVPNGYSLKNPSAGEYITSYNFYDIDNDDKDEAVVFYETNDMLGVIKMTVLKSINEKWNVVGEIEGKGEDVYSLDFSDVNNDGKTELLVCWNTISNSTNHTLNVYTLTSNKNEVAIKQLINEEKVINNYTIVDFDENGKNELLLFNINSGSKSSAKAELYSLNQNRYHLLGETKLDSHISSYVNISSEKAEGDVRIYADALNSNGESMLTEIIYWSNTYDTIVSPFYSYSSGITSGTRRNCILNSADINGDGLIEIPVDKSLKGLPKQVVAVDWKIFKNTVMLHKEYSLYVKNDSYNVIIPDKYFGKISVSYKEENKQLVVTEKSSKKQVFSIMPVLKVLYDKDQYHGYTVIKEDSGYYYLAKCNDNKNIKITIDDLKKSIKTS